MQAYLVQGVPPHLSTSLSPPSLLRGTGTFWRSHTMARSSAGRAAGGSEEDIAAAWRCATQVWM